MTNQQTHILPKTAVLKKMFNMCLPATSIGLRKRYLKWFMHAWFNDLGIPQSFVWSVPPVSSILLLIDEK